MKQHLALAAALAVTAAAATLAAPANWPRFRGPDGAGCADGKPLPVTWSATRNVMWKAAVPGKGWSSPVVWGNRVFVTSAVTVKAVEPPWTPEKMEDNGKGFPTTDEQVWTVTCLDLRTGRTLWSREASRAVPSWLIHPKGSHASETPVTDGERVYAHFGGVGLFCYSVDGKPLWSFLVRPHKMLFNWGTAAGPAVHAGRVYLADDSEEGSTLTCLDARTGRKLWQTTREEGSNWCNPLVWRSSKRVELVTSGSKRVRSYDPDGKLLWELSGMSYATIPSPYAVADTLYIASGHASGPVRPIYAIAAGASGDISLPRGAKSGPFIRWCEPAAGPYVPTPITYRGHVYALTDVSGLFCYRADTGAQLYARQRFGPGGEMFSASPVAGDGKLYCQGEKGDTFVVQAGPEFKVLSKNSLGEDSLATPAIVDGTLLIRTLTRVYRIKAGQ